MDWEYNFSSIILDRGHDYYLYDNVESIQRIENGYRAFVRGTEDYMVHIYFNGTHVGEMDCTCPYAEAGNNCKHMAAVLFAIDEQGETEEFAGDVDKVEDMSAGMEVDEIRKELLSILEKDEDLKAGFMMKYARSSESIIKYIGQIKQTADAILYQCSDRGGYIDWRNAGIFASRLVSEVILYLMDFTSDDEEAKAAFDVSLYVYELFYDTEIDDSGGETQYFTDECISLWDKVLAGRENSELAEYMLDKLTLKYSEIGMGEYMADEIDEFISEHFKGKSFVLKKLEMIDERISSLENDDSWSGEFYLTRSIVERIELMKEMAIDEIEIDAFKNKYWHLPVIRKMEMEELENAGKLSELIQLLEKSKEMDKSSMRYVSEHSRKLVECYNKDGYYGKAKDELFVYITEYSLGDLDAFIELRASLPREHWEYRREEIFGILQKKRVDIKPLLVAEELKERLYNLLIDEINRSSGFEKHKLNEIGEYESVLKPEYQTELLELYVRLIWKMSEHAGGRSHYQEIVGFIRRMFTYEGGAKRAKKLLEGWRFTYSNRPAMQDELRVLESEIWKRLS
jgi:hypothetical protein